MISRSLVIALWCVVAVVSSAHAHDRSVSYSEWTYTNLGFTASFSISARELTRWVGSESELSSALARELVATRGAAPCALDRNAVKRQPSRAGLLRWELIYSCPLQGEVALTSEVLAQLAPHHIHFVRIARRGESPHEYVLTEGHRSIVLRAEAVPEGRTLRFIWLGVEHIASGYDHLAFLLLLVLPQRRLREVLLIITGFTVGHSLTLALAALGVVAVDARLVEAFVAGSIVLAAVDAAWPRSLAWTCGLASGFGLVHGLAFASVLRALTLTDAQRMTALLGFNLGVELGQLAVAALTLTALGWLHAHLQRSALPFVRYACGIVAGAALVLSVSRALVG